MTTSPVTIPSPWSGRAPSVDDRLARVDPDPHLQREAGSASFSSSIASRIREPRPDRALGVVLVRHRCAEHGHDRVADELLHRTAVALDLLAQARMVGADAAPGRPPGRPLGGGGEADQVAEEHRDDLALLERQGPRASASGAAQNGQNGNSPGSSLPQDGQVATRGESRTRIRTTGASAAVPGHPIGGGTRTTGAATTPRLSPGGQEEPKAYCQNRRMSGVGVGPVPPTQP